MASKHGFFRPQLGRGAPLANSTTMREGGRHAFTNAEASALVARFTVAPTNARKALIDTLVGSLKTAGVWSKLDALYVMAAADAQAAQRNWIADAFNLTPNNAPSFAADRGYTGNGTTSYLDTNYTPGSGQYALNSAHMGIWSRTSALEAGESGGGQNATSSVVLLSPRHTSDLFRVRMNDLTVSTWASASGAGHFIGNRSTSASKEAYINGATAGAAASVASTLIPNLPMTLLRVGSTYSARQIAAGHIGSSLTAGEVLATYNALNAYMTAVGAA